MSTDFRAALQAANPYSPASGRSLLLRMREAWQAYQRLAWQVGLRRD